MEGIKRETFSEEEILEIAGEIQPLMDKMVEFIKKYNTTGFVSLTAWDDNTAVLNGTGTKGWRIDRDEEGAISITYNFTKKIIKEEGNE